MANTKMVVIGDGRTVRVHDGVGVQLLDPGPEPKDPPAQFDGIDLGQRWRGAHDPITGRSAIAPESGDDLVAKSDIG